MESPLVKSLPLYIHTSMTSRALSKGGEIQSEPFDILCRGREVSMFENIPRRVSKFAHISEETTCFECPDCDSPVAAMLVFPNSKQQLVLLGRCTVCYAKGDKRTSYAHINCDYEVWNRLMSDDHIPCLREG